MDKVLNVCTVPVTGNGIALQLAVLNQELGGIAISHFGGVAADVAPRLASATMICLPDRLHHPVKYIFALSRAVRKNRYRVVHVHGNSCTMALDLLGAFLGGAKGRIAHCHNTACVYDKLSRLLKLPFRLLVTHRAACGKAAGEWLYGRRDFTVLPVSVNAPAFAFDPAAREEVRRELGLEGKIAVGCAAGLTQVKNHAALLRAFVRLPEEYALVLMGDGPLRQKLEDLASGLGISDRVHFLGQRSDVPRLLNGMDRMALASFAEGFPTVALEWQCAGLPAALSDRITRDCNLTGALRYADPGDEAAFAEAIANLPAADRATASESGRETVARAGYDTRGVAEAYRRLWNSIQK